MRHFYRSTGMAVLTFIALASPSASSDTPANLNREQSLYSDMKANNVGDVISVIISESNSATNNSRTTTKKQDKASASGDATTGALAGLFPGMSGTLDVSNQFNGQGGTLRNGSINSRMSVKVVDVMPNGNLVVEGSKTMEINQEMEVITLSGTIKPEDITSTNTVYSYQLANAKITYKGKGVSSQGERPGVLARLLNWIL